jgi:hypothetical protein
MLPPAVLNIQGYGALTIPVTCGTLSHPEVPD